MRAWLVTWDWMGDHAAREERIVSVLSRRSGAETVRQHVERLYIDLTCSLAERLEYARYNKPSSPAYPAAFMRVGPNNIQFQGRIMCGHNPWLYARLVTDLRIVTTEFGDETLKWSELPLPNFPI